MNSGLSCRITRRLVQIFHQSSRYKSTSISCSRCSDGHVHSSSKANPGWSLQTLQESWITKRMVGATCLLHVRTMAGHNKWSNIKHIKAAKDGERSKVIAQITNKIKLVIKENGNPDPKLNSGLARVVAEAKSKNVPSSNIDSAIEQAVKARNATSIVFYEGRGPGGSYFIIEASTDKAVKTKNDLQSTIKKQGATIGEQGTAKHAFEKKGVVEVTAPEGDVDVDKFVDMAIEAGAEEVTMETDEMDDKYLKFVCEAEDLYTVKKELERKSLELRAFSVDFLPVQVVSPSPKDMELISKLMEKLEDFPEVLRVFINVDAPDS